MNKNLILIFALLILPISFVFADQESNPKGTVEFISNFASPSELLIKGEAAKATYEYMQPQAVKDPSSMNLIWLKADKNGLSCRFLPSKNSYWCNLMLVVP